MMFDPDEPNVTVNHESHERFTNGCGGCREEADRSYAEFAPSYRAERIYRQSIALARADLDMGLDVDEEELMRAIQLRFK